MAHPNSTRKTIYCISEGQSTPGFVDRRDLSTQERILAALKMTGIFWAIAAFTVLVPVLHFVLVPGFLILGGVLGFSSWMTRSEILGGEFTCPNCKKTNSMERQKESFPKNVRCSGCYFTLEIKEKV